MKLLDKPIKSWFAGDIADAVKSGECSPVEIAQSYFEYIESGEPDIQAFESFDKDVVLNEIDECEFGADGSLAGVPLAVKDVFNTKDYMTQMGSEIWKGFTPGNNARVIDHILWEGAFILGKTVTAEFAVHHPGKTKNPINSDHIIGTSSSGSAAAVSSGMSPLALGTQTAGSTIRPSSYSGIFGFKPTFGLIPRTGILKTLDTLDHVCLMAKTASDIFLALEASRVRGKNHPYVNQTLDKEFEIKDKYNVAFIKTVTWDDANDYTQDAMENFVSEFSKERNIDLNEISLSDDLETIHENHNLIYEKALSYYFSDEIENHPNEISEIFHEMIERGKLTSASEYHSGLEKQVKHIKEFDELMKDYDFIITHSVSGEAPEESMPSEPPDPCLIWTYLHAPSMNIPVFSGPNKLPFGLQLVSSRYNDNSLIEMASQIERNHIL